MNGYTLLLDTLYDLLINDPCVETVTKGGDIDINKKNEFNLAHIRVVNSLFNKAVITFDCVVFAMALRDTNKHTAKDKWTENDNENNNLNETLYVLHRLYQKLDKIDGDFTLTSVDPLEPFTEANVNVVDGWFIKFTVTYAETESGAC